MHEITRVKILQDYHLELSFDDGVSGTVDLSHLAGKGVFARWLDRKQFEKVRIGSLGELIWGELRHGQVRTGDFLMAADSRWHRPGCR